MNTMKLVLIFLGLTIAGQISSAATGLSGTYTPSQYCTIGGLYPNQEYVIEATPKAIHTMARLYLGHLSDVRALNFEVGSSVGQHFTEEGYELFLGHYVEGSLNTEFIQTQMTTNDNNLNPVYTGEVSLKLSNSLLTIRKTHVSEPETVCTLQLIAP